jgi:hypothetical protein
MAWMILTGGGPDEPDTGDWDAICSTPGPRQIFAALFEALAPPGMPARTTTEVSEDETHRLHTIWLGTNALGVKVTEVESPETTAFPMHCTWETFGLRGTKVIWKYSLEKAGQRCSLKVRLRRPQRRDMTRFAPNCVNSATSRDATVASNTVTLTVSSSTFRPWRQSWSGSTRASLCRRPCPPISRCARPLVQSRS